MLKFENKFKPISAAMATRASPVATSRLTQGTLQALKANTLYTSVTSATITKAIMFSRF